MNKELENKLIAVIRVRGRVGVRHTISEALNRLNLRRTNNLALVYGTKSNIGMIEQCRDFIAYGTVKEDSLTKLLEKRDVKLSKEEVTSIMTGKKRVRDVVHLPIKMHPPKHGYEGLKTVYKKGGALGYRGEAINELIKRMA